MILGINLTCVLLIDGARMPVEKNPWISFMTAEPMISQLDWKKPAENPSGPGALSAWIAKRCRVEVLQLLYVDRRKHLIETSQSNKQR